MALIVKFCICTVSVH